MAGQRAPAPLPMPPPSDAPTPVCTFCGARHEGATQLPRFSTAVCPGCAARLGRLLRGSPEALAGIWPVLAADDGEHEHEPEPSVRGPDGRVRELREVTAELKHELP